MEKVRLILPGEIVFTNLTENVFSDKLVVDLHNLFETSFLISGFSNSQSFLDSSAQCFRVPKDSTLSKTFDATVGSAKKPAGSFEINQRDSYSSNAKCPVFLHESLRM